MCIIAVKPKNVSLPNYEFINSNWSDNPDGAGIMFIKHNEKDVQLIKGLMTLKELTNAIKDNVTDKDLLVIHFRWATSGKKTAPATHPFVVDNSKEISFITKHKSSNDLFFAHNGVISQLNNSHDISDTQIFASEYLPHISVHDIYTNPIMQSLIEKFIDGSRLVFLHSKYGIKYYGKWHEYKGMMLSKMYCESPFTYDYSWNKWDKKSKKKSKNNFKHFTFENDDYDFNVDDNYWYEDEINIRCESCEEELKGEDIYYNFDYDCHLCRICNDDLQKEIINYKL